MRKKMNFAVARFSIRVEFRCRSSNALITRRAYSHMIIEQTISIDRFAMNTPFLRTVGADRASQEILIMPEFVR
jgi:hypothetical protein